MVESMAAGVNVPGIEVGNATVTDRAGVFYDLPETEYHADRASLSHSGAKKLLAPSTPAHYRASLDAPPPDSDALRIGSLTHGLILGAGADIELLDGDNWRSKAAQDGKRAALADGRIPCLAHELAAAETMRDAVRSNTTADLLLTGGHPEVSYYWRDPATGARLRARADYITRVGDRTALVDLKTTAALGNPEQFADTAARYDYHLQAAWYMAGWQLLHPDEPLPMFLFIVVEKTAPHLTSVIDLTAKDIDMGADDMRAAVDLYAECLEADDWPGYPAGVATINLPAWKRSRADA